MTSTSLASSERIFGTVLRMLADGLTNRQVAERLGLSPHTVKDHTSALYKRLGATNRANAVALARELRLL